MSMKKSHCFHVQSIECTTWDDVVQKLRRSNVEKCMECGHSGMNMWLCLTCLYVGCGESIKDHSCTHYNENENHCLTMNMSTQRIWCYSCELEVIKDNNDPPLQLVDRPVTPPILKRTAICTDDSDSEFDEDTRPKGLTGLQNIGNTCYLNAALQCLSNCQPLTRFFIDCSGFVRTEKKPYLCKAYHHLVGDMWSKKRLSYVVPNHFVNLIKIVHPMFKGWTQQDSQEFLRCFMDEMHEELKDSIEPQLENNCKDVIKSDIDINDKMQAGDFEQFDLNKENESSDKVNNSAVKLTEQISNVADDEKIQMTTEASNGIENKVDNKKPLVYKAGSGACKKDEDMKYRSIISDLFDGEIESSVQCLTCERHSVRIETFQDLSLPIPSKECLQSIQAGQIKYQNQNVSFPQSSSLTSNTNVNRAVCSEVQQTWISWFISLLKNWIWGPNIRLQDCLTAFFSPDDLKGDNMYSCEKCKKLRNGMKYSTVVSLPEILCIHLKRFRHEFLGSSKISTFVSFPIEKLNMAPYVNQNCNDKTMEYDLVGVIVHQGTAGGGHYISYAYNSPSQSWYEFDDQLVTEVDLTTVESAEAYVLFYKKRESDETISIRQKAMHLNEQSQSSLMKFFVSKQWINRFNTFSECGPIDNSDFLCKHGGIPPEKFQYYNDLVAEVPQPLWEYLYDLYGGGPAVNHLHQCNTCLENLEKLKKRRNYELDTFIELNEKFRLDESPVEIYAISMVWFRKWEMFVKGQRKTPPPPIDNFPISKGKHIKSNSDRGQLSADLWKFMVNIYGGGPELMIKTNEDNESKL